MRILGAAAAAIVLLSHSAGATAPQLSPRPAARDGMPVAAVSFTKEADFADWTAGFRDRAIAAGIRPDAIDAAMSGLRYDAAIIERDRNQSEFTKPIWDYLDSAASDVARRQRPRRPAPLPGRPRGDRGALRR